MTLKLGYTTNMTMENLPFEDVSSIKNGDFPLTCWFSGVYMYSVNIFPLQFWTQNIPPKNKDANIGQTFSR